MNALTTEPPPLPITVIDYCLSLFERRPILGWSGFCLKETNSWAKEKQYNTCFFTRINSTKLNKVYGILQNSFKTLHNVTTLNKHIHNFRRLYTPFLHTITQLIQSDKTLYKKTTLCTTLHNFKIYEAIYSFYKNVYTSIQHFYVILHSYTNLYKTIQNFTRR